MGPNLVKNGIAVVEVLAGDSRTQLDAWVNNFMLFTTTVRDPDAMSSQTLTALVRREYCYVVDLFNMKIDQVYVGTTDGSKPGGVNSTIEGCATFAFTLLGGP
jgi:hypothetical protein